MSRWPSSKGPIRQYRVLLEQTEEGFDASVPGLPGCHSQGAREEEALDNIESAIQEYLSVAEQLRQAS